DAAAVGAARDERRRRRPGELSEVTVHVRLVEIAAVVRDRSEGGPGRSAETLDRSREANHARERLRRYPDLLAEASGQGAVARAALPLQRRERRASGRSSH